MNRFTLAVVGAALLTSMPTSAESQRAVGTLEVESHIMRTSAPPMAGNGGAFAFNEALVQIPVVRSLTFNDYVMFCIDAGRTVNVGSSYTNYSLYTFSEFANSTFGLANGVTVEDLKFIANKVEGYTTGTSVANNQRQGDIWHRFANADRSVSMLTPTRNWGVLANGKNQTFLVEVPEPSTYILTSVGLVGLILVSRRRKAELTA